MNLTLQQQIPELSPAQWKLLERVILEGVIGEDEIMLKYINSEPREIRNKLRATQRLALRSLLYGGENGAI